MPISAISLEPELSPTASLRQAVEWIAFDLPPLTPAFDQMLRQAGNIQWSDFRSDEENQKLEEAKQALFTALRQGKLTATAQILGEIFVNPMTGEFETNFYDNELALKNGAPVLKQQVISPEAWTFPRTNFEKGELIYSTPAVRTKGILGEPSYFWATGIYVSADQLMTLFPHVAPPPEIERHAATPEYISPYIDLMFRAIQALGITAQNQPVKKVIEGWLIDNAPAGGLSGRDIQAMATFIRLPEKKKGGSGGDNRSRTAPKTKSKPATRKSK